MLTLCCSAILNCSDENVTIPRLPKREAAARPRPRATHAQTFYGVLHSLPRRAAGRALNTRSKRQMESNKDADDELVWPRRRRQVAAGLWRDCHSRKETFLFFSVTFKARCSCSHPSSGDLILVTTLMKK